MLCQVFFCKFPTVAPWQPTTIGGLQIHDLYWGSHIQHINSTHSLIPPHESGDYHWYCGLHKQYGAAPAPGTSVEAGASPSGVPLTIRHLAISWNPGGTPLGQHPYLLHPGLPILGRLQMRWTWNCPPGPAILLLRGIKLFYTTVNCSYSTAGVLWICRVHFLQQLPFGRNEPVSTVDIPVFLLP